MWLEGPDCLLKKKKVPWTPQFLNYFGPDRAALKMLTFSKSVFMYHYAYTHGFIWFYSLDLFEFYGYLFCDP